MKRPNILFLQVDQLDPMSLAAYGNTVVKTPNIDELAAKGAVFETAYCNFPLCAPSRFSMATGSLCSVNGAYDNAAEMRAEFPTYAHYLRERGYRTTLSGKMHFVGPDQHHGFEERLTADLYPADFSWVPNWGNEGQRDTSDPRAVLVAGVCESSVQIEFDEEVTFKARRHLFDIARSSDDRPFFLQVSFTHPHDPYLCRKKYWDLYEGMDVPPPAVPAMTREQHDPHSARVLDSYGMLDQTFADADILRARRAHYGAISYIDEKVGEIIHTLKSADAFDNTMIVFTADHGEFLGERGMWLKKHFFEPSLRVPLIIAGPGIAPQRVGELASLIDLLPTFNGMADGKTWTPDNPDLAGADLTEFFGKSKAGSERTVYAEYLAESTPGPIYMVRRGSHKFIGSSHDPAMLFDVEADPLELDNLAEDKAHAKTVAGFQAEIEAKWDDEALTRQIVESQRRRIQVLRANKNGGLPPRWNHGERPGEEVIWYRGDIGYNEWAFDYLPDASEPLPIGN